MAMFTGRSIRGLINQNVEVCISLLSLYYLTKSKLDSRKKTRLTMWFYGIYVELIDFLLKQQTHSIQEHGI